MRESVRLFGCGKWTVVLMVETKFKWIFNVGVYFNKTDLYLLFFKWVIWINHLEMMSDEKPCGTFEFNRIR